ncbi:hypothetical protein VKT23_018521 [Stygiomarasmius scandens]|uniref:F-box domain-containing protein n=1 Tax=Marasmiellus scandens TaxID=2682957 RepID=A0ABR1IP13_9AGAR
MSMSCVCSRWRSICLSTPRLWSRIELYFSETNLPRDQPDRSLNQISLLLSRSRDSALDFTFYFLLGLDSEWGIDLFKPFARESHRWRNARIRLPVGLRTQKTLITLDWPDNFSLLENLYMETRDPYGVEVLPFTPHATIPRLNILTLKGNWQFKDNVRWGLASPESFQNIAPKVLILDLTFLQWSTAAFASPSTVVQIRGHFGMFVSPATCRARCLEMYPGTRPKDVKIPLDLYLQMISLPNVTEFVFGRQRPSHPLANLTWDDMIFRPCLFPTAEFVDLVSARCNGAGRITHFTLANYVINDTSLLQIITHLPSLTFLCVDERFPYLESDPYTDAWDDDDDDEKDPNDVPNRDFSLTPALFRSLTHLISSLEELKLAFHPKFPDPPTALEALWDFVASRSPEKGCLKKVWVYMEGHRGDIEADKRILSLRQMGLELFLD